jgi:hypothetical protein
LVILAPVDEHLAGAQRLGLACDGEVGLGALEQLSDLSGERLGWVKVTSLLSGT